MTEVRLGLLTIILGVSTTLCLVVAGAAFAPV